MELQNFRSSTFRLLAACSAAALLFIAGSPAEVSAQATKTFRFGHMWPPADVWGQGAQRFADLVKERTGGKYEIRVYPSGQLGIVKLVMPFP